MTPDDLVKIRTQLIAHEALRLKPYDDATGRDLEPGVSLVGKITIGVGLNLSSGISRERALRWLDEDIASTIQGLQASYPWFTALDSTRQRAVIDLAFNQGVEGMQRHSPRAVAALVAHDYETAANELLDGPWSREVGQRAHTIASMIRTGHDPAVTVTA
jgi:lysozyme